MELSVDQIITLHRGIIARDGGDNRIISEANLLQLVFRANSEEDPLRKAALILYSLVAYPSFREGNTGTGIALAGIVLKEHGYSLGPDAGEELVQLAAGVAAFDADLPDIETWFDSHARKQPR